VCCQVLFGKWMCQTKAANAIILFYDSCISCFALRALRYRFAVCHTPCNSQALQHSDANTSAVKQANTQNQTHIALQYMQRLLHVPPPTGQPATYHLVMLRYRFA
jgi:hypothetical protein